MTKDYYEVLGVDKSVDDPSLKKAYRKLSKQYHPDVNPDDPQSEEKFKEVAEAYGILSNKEKRQNYDMYGSATGAANPFGGGGNINMDDIFNSFFGGGNPFNGGRRQQKRKGSDIRVNIRVTLDDIFRGTHKKIKYKRKEECDSCKGTGGKHIGCNPCQGRGIVNQVHSTPMGRVQNTVHCPSCGGKGKIITDPCNGCQGQGVKPNEEILEFNIPQGIMDGEVLALRGKGNSIQDGIYGDLLVNIIEIPHEKFRRMGLDIHQRINLSYKDLVLGSATEVETLDGKIRINVKKGTLVGHTLRVPNKGLLRDNRQGDMLIEVWLDIPKDVSEEEKKIIEQLKV